MNPRLKTAILNSLKEMGYFPDSARFQRLAGDGSRRIFWRVVLQGPGASFIVMSNPPDDPALRQENHAYLQIGMHLRHRGVPVPRIHKYDLASGWFLMQDLGPTHLQEAVASGEDPLPLYERVLGHLLHLQIEGAAGFDPSWCCQTGRYDQNVMLRYEADYFKEAFLGRYLGIDAGGPDLDAAFRHLAKTAAEADARFFLHRDFQSRNIMVFEGNIGLVDWQGGRLGPLGYDLASLIIDPYTRLSGARQEMIYNRYLDLIKDHDPTWTGPFEKYFPYLAIQRNLQILGAFSFLSQVMDKPCFETYIPRALSTLDDLLHRVGDREIAPLRELTAEVKGHKKILDIPERGG